MNLKDIMLRGKPVTKRNTVRFPLYKILIVVQFLETENRMMVDRVWGKGGMGCLMGIVSLLQGEFWRLLHNHMSVGNTTLKNC